MQKSIIKHISIFILVFAFVLEAQAQSPVSDLNLIRSKKPGESQHLHNHSVQFMRTRSKNIFIRYNPVSLALGGLMYFYQGVVSPQLPSECLYVETCSHFSKNLFYEYGIVKGLFTTSDRLMRCNRISALDVHPLLIDEKTGKVTESVDIYKTSP